MRKPLFTRITHLSSRTHLGRLLHWNVQKDILAEIGPLQYQLDQLGDLVQVHQKSLLAGMKVSRDFQKMHSDQIKSIKKELRIISIAYAIALLTVSLGCLIGLLVN